MKKTKDESYTLLVWETNPESIEFYVIPNHQLTEDDMSMLRTAHGRLINAEYEDETGAIEKALQAINDFLTVNAEHAADPKRASRWAKFRALASKPIEGKTIVRVFHAGFIL